MAAVSDQKSSKRRHKNRTKLYKSEGAGQKKGVVYLGHLPDGFCEKEIRQYFKQFGTVRRVKVSRSIKNGKSKGYGFIQFVDNDVAKIAAESSNNYLMFKKNLRAELMDPAKVHDSTFKGCTRKFVATGEPLRRKRVYNKAVEASKKTTIRKLAKSNRKKKFLESLGYKLPTTDSASQDVMSTPSAPRTDPPKARSSEKKSPKVRSSSTKKSATKKSESVALTSVTGEVDSEDEITFKTPANVVKASGKRTQRRSSSKRKKSPKTSGTQKPEQIGQTPVSPSPTVTSPGSKTTPGGVKPDKSTPTTLHLSGGKPSADKSTPTILHLSGGKPSADKSTPTTLHLSGSKPSADKSSSAKKTPKSGKKETSKSSMQLLTPSKDSKEVKPSVKSTRPHSDASPELPAKTFKTSKAAQKNEPKQVTPEKRKSNQFSPRLTRSALKKRKPVV